MNRFFAVVLSFLVLIPAALAAQTPETQAGEQEAHVSDPNKLYTIIHTERGTIKLEMFPEGAPLTVANFVNLADRGYYDGIRFHRVVANFVIQGGDPTGSGSGGPGYRFGDEFDPTLRHDKPGILSMANAGPGTNGSQFFVTHTATPHLDDRHSVFGVVVEGMDVVNAIRQGDTMTKVEVEGDWSALREQVKDQLAEWNAILDKEHPRKR